MSVHDQHIADLLERMDPKPDALLDVLRPRVADTTLDHMAAMDGGVFFDEYLAALQSIRDTGRIPAPLRWIPGEVLALTRWSEPERVGEKTERTGSRGHIMRAFACAALLRAAADPENYNIEGENETVVQLLESAIRLGRDVCDATRQMLAWRVQGEQCISDERPFFAMGILLLSAHLFEAGDDATDLVMLADWVVPKEAAVHDRCGARPDQWLPGLTNYDQCHHKWRALAREILVGRKAEFPREAADALHRICQRLLPDEC